MSRRGTNSLVLAALLLVLGLGAYSLVYAGFYGDYLMLRETRDRRRADLRALEELAGRRQAFADSLAAFLDSLRSMPKVVLARENSNVTFDYLNQLATVDGHHLRLNLEAGRQHDYGRYHSSSYMIEGEASFRSLYAFLWKLEHYKRLYTIESLHCKEVTKTTGSDETPRSLVRFRMSLTGYGTGSTWSADTTLVDEGQPEPLGHNPFLPLVRDYIPPNSQNLLDVDRAQLQGLSGDRAFVLDQRQQLQVLREGDRVYLGLLTDLNRDGRYAEFTLNKGGFVEKVVLRLPRRP